MAKVKFNVKGVEVRKGGGEPIPKGVYTCDIESCVVAKPQGKDQRIEVVYVVNDGDHKGRKLFDYINLESEGAAWKLREFLETFGLVTGKKEVGEFDPSALVGESCNVRVVHQAGKGEYEGKTDSRVGGTFGIDEDEEKENLDDDDEADDDEAGEDDAEPDDDDEDGVELDELDRTELKKFIKEQELEIVVKKSMSDDDIRAAIAEAMGADDDEPDYSSMDLDELKATCKERGLKTTGSKKLLIARLEKDDEASDDEEPF